DAVRYRRRRREDARRDRRPSPPVAGADSPDREEGDVQAAPSDIRLRPRGSGRRQLSSSTKAIHASVDSRNDSTSTRSSTPWKRVDKSSYVTAGENSANPYATAPLARKNRASVPPTDIVGSMVASG